MKLLQDNMKIMTVGVYDIETGDIEINISFDITEDENINNSFAYGQDMTDKIISKWFSKSTFYTKYSDLTLYEYDIEVITIR